MTYSHLYTNFHVGLILAPVNDTTQQSINASQIDIEHNPCYRWINVQGYWQATWVSPRMFGLFRPLRKNADIDLSQ